MNELHIDKTSFFWEVFYRLIKALLILSWKKIRDNNVARLIVLNALEILWRRKEIFEKYEENILAGFSGFLWRQVRDDCDVFPRFSKSGEGIEGQIRKALKINQVFLELLGDSISLSKLAYSINRIETGKNAFLQYVAVGETKEFSVEENAVLVENILEIRITYQEEAHEENDPALISLLKGSPVLGELFSYRFFPIMYDFFFKEIKEGDPDFYYLIMKDPSPENILTLFKNNQKQAEALRSFFDVKIKQKLIVPT